MNSCIVRSPPCACCRHGCPELGYHVFYTDAFRLVDCGGLAALLTSPIGCLAFCPSPLLRGRVWGMEGSCIRCQDRVPYQVIPPS